MKFSGPTPYKATISAGYLLISAALIFPVSAQTPSKKNLPTQTAATSAAASALPSTAPAVVELKIELDAVKQQLVSAEAENQQYTGGLIKSQIELRIALLRTTEALVQQRIAALTTGAKMNIEVTVHKVDTTALAAIEAEIATQKQKVELAQKESDKYTGGLIKAQIDSSIATMNGTLAALEQRALTIKFGLPVLPAVAVEASASSAGAKPAPTAAEPKKGKPQDDIVSVTLVSKQFSEQRYEKMVIFDLEFLAINLKKPARAIKGTLNVNDLFGEKKMGIGWTIDRPVSPGDRLRESGQGFKYNQFMEPDVWVRNTESNNMKLSYTVKSILYEDGTREDF